MSGAHQNIIIYEYLDGEYVVVVTNATVTVAGTVIAHQGNGYYHGLVSPMIAEGEEVAVTVTIPGRAGSHRHRGLRGGVREGELQRARCPPRLEHGA